MEFWVFVLSCLIILLAVRPTQGGSLEVAGSSLPWIQWMTMIKPIKYGTLLIPSIVHLSCSNFCSFQSVRGVNREYNREAILLAKKEAKYNRDLIMMIIINFLRRFINTQKGPTNWHGNHLYIGCE